MGTSENGICDTVNFYATIPFSCAHSTYRHFNWESAGKRLLESTAPWRCLG